MSYLILIKIKNEDFVPSRYGLNSNFFSLDIVDDFNDTKNISITSAPVLDGTTRISNISREPRSFSIRGSIAEHHFNYNETAKDFFVRPTKVKRIIREKNEEKITTNKLKGNESRMLLQKRLLDDLRDNATFLDLYTNGGEMIYTDFILKQVSSSQNKFGQITVNLSFEEVLFFDNPKFIDNDTLPPSDGGLGYLDIFNSIVFNPTSFLPDTIYNLCANLIMQLPRNSKVVIGANEPQGRPIETNLQLNSMKITLQGNGAYITPHNNKKNVEERKKSHTLWSGNGENIWVEFFRGKPTSAETYSANDGYQKMTFNILSDVKLNVGTGDTSGIDNYDEIVTLTGLTVFPNLGVEFNKQIGFFATNSAERMAHKDYANPDFYINKVGYSNYVLDKNEKFYNAQAKGWSFLRETETITDENKLKYLTETYGEKKNFPVVYGVYPNLLGDDSKGYLYNATFATHGFRLSGEESAYTYNVYHTMIYIIPEYWAIIKERLQALSDLNSSPFNLATRLLVAKG